MPLKTTPEQRARLHTELQQGQWPTVPAWAVSLLDDVETLLGALETIQQAARTRAEAWGRDRAHFPHAKHHMDEARALRDIIEENIPAPLTPEEPANG